MALLNNDVEIYVYINILVFYNIGMCAFVEYGELNKLYNLQ
jgi:hypothetical protein